jgi:hypothetical protein
MRSPLRIPKAELEQVITQAVEKYMREVTNIRRGLLRNVITDTCQAEGLPVPEGQEMEAHIDVLEALFDVGNQNQDTILQLIDEMDDPPMSMPVSAHSNKKKKRNRGSKNRSNQ